MTLENALENVRREYYKACATEWIRDPLSYALYNVWKQADSERRKKEEQNDENRL